VRIFSETASPEASSPPRLMRMPLESFSMLLLTLFVLKLQHAVRVNRTHIVVDNHKPSVVFMNTCEALRFSRQQQNP
jgi:hypothetical protein